MFDPWEYYDDYDLDQVQYDASGVDYAKGMAGIRIGGYIKSTAEEDFMGKIPDFLFDEEEDDE